MPIRGYLYKNTTQYQFMIINFSVVHQPNVGIFENSHWLHSSQIINDSQTMKPEGAVWKVVDGFQSEGIGAPVCDFVSSIALDSYVIVTSENRPNPAHFDDYLPFLFD